ncbi:hypothetical protein Droror1_Dr00002604 [Drosera rotundifolia]
MQADDNTVNSPFFLLLDRFVASLLTYRRSSCCQYSPAPTTAVDAVVSHIPPNMAPRLDQLSRRFAKKKNKSRPPSSAKPTPSQSPAKGATVTDDPVAVSISEIPTVNVEELGTRRPEKRSRHASPIKASPLHSAAPSEGVIFNPVCSEVEGGIVEEEDNLSYLKPT